ncbi:MAG: biotin/lipoyl-containing protein, partial [Acidimicrobiia bacterium]
MVTTEQGTTEVTVPDIGDYSDVPVIEVLVAAGDAVNADDPLVTLESDKATMDIPAPASGTVSCVLVAVGDRVIVVTAIAVIEPGEGALRQPPNLVMQPEPTPMAIEAEPLPAAAAVGAATPST